MSSSITSEAVHASTSCATWLRLSPNHWWLSNLVGRSIGGNLPKTDDGEPHAAPHHQESAGTRPADVWASSGTSPRPSRRRRLVEFAGGPAAALAASHLRSPATFTVQLDHLLSSVTQVNHTRGRNWRVRYPVLAGIEGFSSLPPTS